MKIFKKLDAKTGFEFEPKSWDWDSQVLPFHYNFSCQELLYFTVYMLLWISVNLAMSLPLMLVMIYYSNH
jgi:hypothetical protein